jgi:hypothetical protein
MKRDIPMVKRAQRLLVMLAAIALGLTAAPAILGQNAALASTVPAARTSGHVRVMTIPIKGNFWVKPVPGKSARLAAPVSNCEPVLTVSEPVTGNPVQLGFSGGAQCNFTLSMAATSALFKPGAQQPEAVGFPAALPSVTSIASNGSLVVARGSTHQLAVALELVLTDGSIWGGATADCNGVGTSILVCDPTTVPFQA